MPGIPFIYYGDEIAMRFIEGLPSKEGAYTSRTGSRTPMQWDRSANLGFSTADASQLYLPVDSVPAAPTVEKQSRKQTALLSQVKELIRLRRDNPALSAEGLFEPLYAEAWKYPFIYSRSKAGKTFVIAVNPSDSKAQAEFELKGAGKLRLVHGDKVPHTLHAGQCKMTMKPLSYAIFEVSGTK